MSTQSVSDISALIASVSSENIVSPDEIAILENEGVKTDEGLVSFLNSVSALGSQFSVKNQEARHIAYKIKSCGLLERLYCKAFETNASLDAQTWYEWCLSSPDCKTAGRIIRLMPADVLIGLCGPHFTFMSGIFDDGMMLDPEGMITSPMDEMLHHLQFREDYWGFFSSDFLVQRIETTSVGEFWHSSLRLAHYRNDIGVILEFSPTEIFETLDLSEWWEEHKQSLSWSDIEPEFEFIINAITNRKDSYGGLPEKMIEELLLGV